MLTLSEIKQELGIDFDDHDERLSRYIDLAYKWLDGAIDQYNPCDERVKQLALLFIEDLYDRNLSVKEKTTISKIKNDLLMQLQCESRGDSNGNL